MLRLVWFYFLHNRGSLSTKELHERIFAGYFKGQSKEKFRSLAAQFLEVNGKALFYGPAVGRLLKAQLEGEKVAICSSSPDFLVECFAAHFQTELWCGSPYLVDKQGDFTLISSPVLGEDKVDYMASLQRRLSIGREETIAYSDSVRDLVFLQAAGKSVGVQPDKELYKICVNQKWEIL